MWTRVLLEDMAALGEKRMLYPQCKSKRESFVLEVAPTLKCSSCIMDFYSRQFLFAKGDYSNNSHVICGSRFRLCDLSVFSVSETNALQGDRATAKGSAEKAL